ncbi:MAG: SpaA isopeptide-forming pilin-related protein, partial [Eubacteriales bacterium]|nr:SpaA isopeptide-forming pilin-related protein [Eubacteriales bacterium]
TETETETETESETTEPSDGSLTGSDVYFKDMTEAVSILYVKFDGGEEEAREVEFLLNEEGYFTGKVPEGDYSRMTFRYESPDGEKITIRPSWHYYGGETALKNTEVVKLEPDKKYVYCYMMEPERQWDTETENYYVEGTESYWDILLEEEEEVRFIEPSTGEWGGEVMHFVNLFWEDVNLGNIYAVFQGGTEEDREILMSRGGRGKYSVTIPEGDYSRVSFCRCPEKGSDETEEDASENTAKNLYEIYGTPFQYYGEESAAEGCVPVFYVPEAGDTFYYDAERPGRSYWSADALYEGPVGAVMMFALPEGAADQAGNILYFADLSPDDKVHVKRVTMQFFDANDAADKIETVMYEGREGIFSAPIPEGGREEVTFHMEFDDGTSYQIVRRFNIYTENSTNAAESFVYEAGVMDAFFFNNVHENVGYDEIADCYWGPHPSVTNRGIGGQYFYVDTTDRNENGIFIDPTTLTIDYGDGPVQITQYTRDPNIYYFQFPIDCSAREHTILTLKGRLGYADTYAGEKTYDEITFRFCYPYNSNKKMIVADNLREFATLFEEFVLSDTDQYVLYDNSTTGFTKVQYRVKKEDGDWTVWNDLKKTAPDAWKDKPNAALVENLWGAEITSEYKYVQFRGTKSTQTTPGENDYLWHSTIDTSSADTLARIPSESFSYPCFYGIKTDDTGAADVNITTINGVWMSALDIRDLGDNSYEIPTDNFRKEQDAYYGTSTFYDYYTDPELNGIKLSAIAYGSMVTGRINTALSSYYQEKNVSDTIYLNAASVANKNYYSYNEKINDWDGNGNNVVSGAVKADLSSSNTLLMTNGSECPLFNESFLRGNNSLGANLGRVYDNVYFPFVKNEAGYWEFDSANTDQTLRLNYDVNHGYFLDRTRDQFTVYNVKQPAENSFFPFNGQEDQKEKNNNYLNYLFGTCLEIPFTLPEGNEVVMQEGASAEPVIFTFAGDDDAWVFVDGKLVMDIGGIHNAIKGTINFKTGTATVLAGGDKNGQSLTKNFTLDTTITTHTLTMFYMERGKGSSNLKVTFNFPKQNTLNVTNEIDTSAANPIFSSALANIGSFAYKIKNLATSGEPLSVEDSAGYVGLGNPSVYFAGSLDIKQDVDLNTGNTDQEIIDQIKWVDNNVDVSGQAYLRFEAYNNTDVADNAGESIFVAFQDETGNTIGGWASRLAYGGSSNALGNKEWSLVRVDINKLQYMNGATSFDRSNVTKIGFAARYTTPVSVRNLAFYQSVTQLPSHGFSVEQKNISDYGSIAKKGLSDANGAWYGYYQNGLARGFYRMVENGFFSIGDGERAEFLDKFRAGSYLQITQEYIDSRVFDTSWSIREGENQESIAENYLLASRTDIQKVQNTGTYSSLENISGTTPGDGRIAVGTGAPEGGAFVYRSYENPDDDEMNPINLTAAFRNVLKVGSITINKEVSLEDGKSAEGAVYQFDVAFTNIAGMGLADAPITTTVEVEIGPDGKTGSATFSGIPAGTEYEIHERKQSGLLLKTVEAGTSVSHKDVIVHEGSEDGPAYAEGTAYASDQVFTFTNAVEPFVMTVEKRWEDENIVDKRPSAVGIRILRREGTSTTWENVTKTFFNTAIGEGDNAYITLNADNEVNGNPNIWRTTTPSLDVISPNGKVYTYKIEEVEVEGAEGWSLDNYVAEYVQGDPVTGVYIVTNTPNAVEVRKVWEDGNDASRPIAVRVKLQRKLESQADTEYADMGENYTVDLSTNGNPRWAHVFEAVERVNADGEKYIYRAVETHLIYATPQTEGKIDREIEMKPEGDTNGYQVQYSSNADNTVLTVTNSKGTGQVVLLKKDRSDQSLLQGATFELERLKPREGKEENEVNFEVSGYNDAAWMVDLNYSSVQLTTDKDGKIDFGYLPYGYYRVTEIKAPEGYILLKQPYDFKITQEALDKLKEDGKAYMTLEITNQSAITLPTSGAAGTIMFTLAGLTLLALALLMYRLHLKRERKGIRR